MWLLPWRREGKKNKSGGSPSPKRKGGGPGTGGSQSAPASPRLSHHKTFGVHIDQAPKAPGSKIPWVVEQIVGYLRATALDTEGIFRVPGSVAEVNELIRAYDEGVQLNLKQYDQHALAGLLKKYFRDLPSPLVVTQLNSQIAALFSMFSLGNGTHKGSIEEVLAHMRAILFQLPTVNFESLKCLVALLVDLYQHTATNKMSLSNIVTCVVPSLDCSPAIITYSIQNYDFFFAEQQEQEIPPPLTHSAPQPILVRRSVSPGILIQPHDSPVVVSPRHTVALPSPSSWMNNSSPASSSILSPPSQSDSPNSLEENSSSTSTTPASSFLFYQSNSPLSISLPSSPRSNSNSNLALSASQRNLSASGGLLPPPPRSTSSSPNRRSSRMSAMVVSHSTPPNTNPNSMNNNHFSPRASLSLQVSTSYPHTPIRTPVSPRAISVSGSAISVNSSSMQSTSTSSPYGPDWNIHARPPGQSVSDRPLYASQVDIPEFRPRASSYAPEPTYMFGSDGELDEKASRRRSFQAKAFDPLRYSRSKSGKRDKELLVDYEPKDYKEKDKSKLQRNSREKSRDKERHKESEKIKDREHKRREREKEKEKEREKEREREAIKEREKRFSRRLTLRSDKEMMRKIEDLQFEIQKERERSESAAAKSAEMEARLKMEETHSNALLGEIERLRRRIRRRSRTKNVVMDSQSYLDGEFVDDDEGEDEPPPEAPPASSNVPWGAGNGKMEVKIRMPMPFP